jgi:hypothetical protein
VTVDVSESVMFRSDFLLVGMDDMEGREKVDFVGVVGWGVMVSVLVLEVEGADVDRY